MVVGHPHEWYPGLHQHGLPHECISKYQASVGQTTRPSSIVHSPRNQSHSLKGTERSGARAGYPPDPRNQSNSLKGTELGGARVGYPSDPRNQSYSLKGTERSGAGVGYPPGPRNQSHSLKGTERSGARAGYPWLGSKTLYYIPKANVSSTATEGGEGLVWQGSLAPQRSPLAQ